MKVSEIIAISSSSGTIKAGLKSFINLFGKRTDIKDILQISDEEIMVLTNSMNIMSKIYQNVKTVEMED